MLAETMNDPTVASAPARRGLPWHWLIFLPVAASVVAGLTTLGIAIRYGDQPLPEMVTRTGPVQYGAAQGQAGARERAISGSAQFGPGGSSVVLTLQGRDLPGTLQLRFWHPTQANRDVLVALTRGDDGSYRGVLPAFPGGLNSLLMAPDQGWEIPGEWSDQLQSLGFTP